MRELGLEGVPFLDRVAAHRPEGAGASTRRAGFLRPAGRWAARGRHRAVRHALSLGSAAGVRGRGGWPSARSPKRSPSTPSRARAARRPREALDHPERTVGLPRGWATAWASTRPAASEADALAAAHHVLLAQGAATCCAPSPGRGRHHVTSSPAPGDGHRRGHRGGCARADGSRNRWILDPVLRGDYPADMLGPSGRSSRRSKTATWRRSPLHSTSSASTTTRAPSFGPIGGRQPVMVVRPRTLSGPQWAGRSTPTGSSSPRPAARRIRAAPALRHRKRRRVRRSGVKRHGRRPEAHLLRRSPSRRDHARHGRRHLRSRVLPLVAARQLRVGNRRPQRFGIVYVDFATLERVPKASYRWYRDLIAAQRQPVA